MNVCLSLFFLIFFFKQETTCLKTLTRPQPVCFCFLKVKSSFSQPTCLSLEAHLALAKIFNFNSQILKVLISF